MEETMADGEGCGARFCHTGASVSSSIMEGLEAQPTLG